VDKDLLSDSSQQNAKVKNVSVWIPFCATQNVIPVVYLVISN
jgi:hypothetical protein